MGDRITPALEPEDVSALTTHNPHKNLTSAINEVSGFATLAVKAVHVALGLVGPVAIPALPAGAVIIGVQAHVTSAYPASTKITVGDHSGSLGALAATAITDGTGMTVTATGDAQIPVYKTPVGALSIAAAGGDGSTGASIVIIKYIDG